MNRSKNRWSAVAKTISAAYGIPRGSNFELYRSGDNSDCDDGERKPAVGDIWILYLKRHDGKYYAAYSIPFYKARKMDVRFGGPRRMKSVTLPPQPNN